MEYQTNQFPLDELAPEQLRSFDRVGVILTSLAKFINGKKLYAKNNPTLNKFANEFERSVSDFFTEQPHLVLGFEKHNIKWQDRVVYKNDKRDESLAFLFYKDGIGEITIDNSVSSDELDRFVDVLKNELQGPSADTDVVTKLWRSDFQGIHYRVLDEYLVGEFGQGNPDDGEADETPLETDDHPDLPSFADTGRVIVKAQDPIEPIDAYLRRLALESCGGETEIEREDGLQTLLASLFTVSSEELKLCQREVAEEKKSDVLVAFIDSILDFALLQDNPSAVRDVSNVIEHITEFLIAEGNLAALTSALETVAAFQTSQNIPDSSASLFERVLERFNDTSFLLSLAKSNDKRAGDTTDLFTYYRAVGRRCVPTICALLDEVDNPKFHTLACDTLVAVGREDIPQIIGKLNMDNPRVAHDIIQLIIAAQLEEIPEIVPQLAHYPDNRVRDAVIKYLTEKGTHDAAILLVELLDDEDRHVRVQTLSALETVPQPIVINKIKALAFDKELGERSMDEQEHVYRALGKLAGEEVLPQLKQMLHKKAIFGFGGSSRNSKVLVIRALEQIANDEALSLLNGLIGDQDALVKSKAQRAIKMIKRSEESQTEGGRHE